MFSGKFMSRYQSQNEAIFYLPELTRRARSTEGYISSRHLRVCRFGPTSGHSEGHFPGQSGTPDFDQNVFVPPPWNFLLCISICKRGHSMFFLRRFLRCSWAWKLLQNGVPNQDFGEKKKRLLFFEHSKSRFLKWSAPKSWFWQSDF